MIVSIGVIEDNKEKYKKYLKVGKEYKVVKGISHCSHAGHRITKGDVVKFLGFERGTNYMRFETYENDYTFLKESIILHLYKSYGYSNKLKEFLNSHPLDKETKDG